MLDQKGMNDKRNPGKELFFLTFGLRLPVPRDYSWWGHWGPYVVTVLELESTVHKASALLTALSLL